MRIFSAWSTQDDAQHAAKEAYRALLDKLGAPPHLLLVHASCAYDTEALIATLRGLAPGVPLQGGTSCLGVMTEEGFHTQAEKGVGLLGFLDPGGAYGVGIAEEDASPEEAVTAALEEALAMAGRPGELPGAVFISVSPGGEEKVIEAIEARLGTGVPIIGGSTADNDMSGGWCQFGNDSVRRNALSAAVLYPGAGLAFSFHSGYEPTAHRGVATRAEGRVLHEIDGEPAARVYDRWTDGLVSREADSEGGLVPAASFSPLGRPVEQLGGIPYFRLSYPVAVTPEEGLHLYTDVQEGDEIVLMTGTRDSLVTRAGRVAGEALKLADFRAEQAYGSLVLFCTGCMLGVQERMAEVVAGLRQELGGTPFLGAFTLGEQGCFIGGKNRHGNLMVAVMTFGPQAGT